MVSHAVWKTWPEGLSRQKLRPKADAFVLTEARKYSFSTNIRELTHNLSAIFCKPLWNSLLNDIYMLYTARVKILDVNRIIILRV